MNKKFIILLAFIGFIGIVFALDSKQDQVNPPATDNKTVTIGSKIFTENILLAEMLSLILEEKYGFQVVRKFKMGGTQLLFSALRQKNIHIYPEYTGTAYIMLFKPEENNDPDFIYEKVKKAFLKKFHISWSLPLGFENTYILAVRKKDRRFKNIYQNSQIQNLSDSLVIGMDHEFLERKDGFSHFSNKYQLNFRKENVISMNQGLMYSALKNTELDIIVAYSTDGRIKKFNLKTLEDDQDFFPVYEAAYIVHTPFLKKFPQIKKAFRALEGKINEEEMANLNRQVDLLKYDISAVAHQFLIDKNILRHNQSIHLKNLSLKNFYFSKIDYFIKIFIEHLILVFTALFLALLVSFPIGIGAVYNQTLERITFTIINTLQTVPSLALLALLIPVFGIGFMPAIIALFIYSLLPMVRNIYEGIKNIDRSFIEVGAGLGLTPWQILKHIQFPLALPLMLAGVRTSAVLVVGTATLAALIGAGGLGDPIFRGISTLDTRLIFLGAVPACLLAIAIDKLLHLLERLVVSKGLKLEKDFKNIQFHL